MEILAVALAVLVGALVKSVTGIGLPPIAIPVLALFVGPQDAIIIMTLSTIVTNTYLTWAYRDAAGQTRYLWTMVLAGAAGAPAGVYLLTSLDPTLVGLVLGVTVLVYIGVSLWKPHLKLRDPVARRAAVPVGLAGGALQGATGLSAVVLASYIHALGVPPRAFVFTISTLFQVFAVVQALGFVVAGVYTPDLVGASVAAAAAAMTVMVFGIRLSPRISPVAFDRLVMAVLGFSALKMLYDAIA
ncbi:MAG: sulfite exporter TauE/SafE family protein [Actinomycetota bacterium]